METPRLVKTIDLPISREAYRIVAAAQYLHPEEARTRWATKLPAVHFDSWESLATDDDRAERTLIIEPADVTKSPEGPDAGPTAVPSQDGARRRYNPFTIEGSALFRVFAGTPCNPEGVLSFANRFGLLFSGSPQALGTRRYVFVLDGIPQASLLQAEDVTDWYAEIKTMRRCLDLWDLARANDDAGLARRLRISEVRHGAVMYDDGSGRPVRLAAKDHPVRPFFDAGQFRLGALHYVKVELNQHIAATLNPTLDWGPDSRLRLTYEPDSLLAALWLQFALAVEGDKDYRQCVDCGRWFEVSPGIARRHRVYCTASCRARAHRRRQAEQE